MDLNKSVVKMSKKGYAKSVFTGILVAFLLSFSGGFLVSYFPLSIWYLVGVLVVIVPLLGIYFEGEGKRASVIMLVLFVASASLVSWPLMDVLVFDQEHKAPRYNLPYEILLHSPPPNQTKTERIISDGSLNHTERERIISDAKHDHAEHDIYEIARHHDEPTWKEHMVFPWDTSPASYPDEPIWGFYEPKYYTVAYKEKNKSIEAVDFYYRGFLTFNPYYSVPQALHKKLVYGYATSIGGYGDYKDKLETHGFKVEETESGFTATNSTTAVHCYLDGKHLVVAKTSKDKRHLLKSGER